MRKNFCRAIAVLATICWTATAVRATDGWMEDGELRSAFSGVTIAGSYADGSRFTERYDGDGKLAYSDPRKAMTGRWSVVSRSFCTLYDTVVSGGCFRVIRHSANCFEFYFLAASEREAAEPGNGEPPSWTARGWNVDRPGTCDERPTV